MRVTANTIAKSFGTYSCALLIIPVFRPQFPSSIRRIPRRYKPVVSRCWVLTFHCFDFRGRCGGEVEFHNIPIHPSTHGAVSTPNAHHATAQATPDQNHSRRQEWQSQLLSCSVRSMKVTFLSLSFCGSANLWGSPISARPRSPGISRHTIGTRQRPVGNPSTASRDGGRVRRGVSFLFFPRALKADRFFFAFPGGRLTARAYDGPLWSLRIPMVVAFLTVERERSCFHESSFISPPLVRL